MTFKVTAEDEERVASQTVYDLSLETTYITYAHILLARTSQIISPKIEIRGWEI